MDLKTIALIVLMIIVCGFSALTIFLNLVRDCVMDLSIGMPIGTWVQFDEMLKLGHGRFVTTMGVVVLMDMKMLSAQPLYEIIEEAEIAEDGEVTVLEESEEDPEVFDWENPQDYEYMLHRRPRRRRRIATESPDTVGGLAPART